MTVNTTTNRVSYAGNGTTTAFAVPFPFLADADLVVIERTDSTGAEVTKTLTTHYTVSGAGGASGTVTMVTAPATGVTLLIYRDPAVTQLVDLVPNDPLPVETAVEQPLDRLTMIAQRNRDLVERALRLPDSDTGFAAGDMKLPAKVTRANQYLAFDAAGKPITSAGTGTDTGLRADLASQTSLSLGADLVGFLQNGAGAVGRKLRDRVKEVVSVKDFGAVGDFNPATGAGTDDRAAIQAAFNYARTVTGGCVVYFPPGRYYGGSAAGVYDAVTNIGTGHITLGISGTQSSAKNIWIVGQGAELYQGAAGKFITVYEADNVRITGLKFFGYTGGTLGAARENDTLLSISNRSYNVRVDQCYFTNSLGDCISIYGDLSNLATDRHCRNITIDHCVLKERYGNGTASVSGGTKSRLAIAVIDCVGLSVHDNTVYGDIDLEPNFNYENIVDVDIHNNRFRSGHVTAQATIGTDYWHDEPVAISGGSIISQGVVLTSVGSPTCTNVCVRNNGFEEGQIACTGDPLTMDLVSGNVFEAGQILLGSNAVSRAVVRGNIAHAPLAAQTLFIKITGALSNSVIANNDALTAAAWTDCVGLSGGIDNGANFFADNTCEGGNSLGFAPAASSTIGGAPYRGTWTPVLTFATPGNLSVTYASQLGVYWRTGKQVTVLFRIQTSAFTHTTAVGGLRITGLPFTSENVADQTHQAAVRWQGITKANYTHVNAYMNQNVAFLEFEASGSAQASSQIVVADVPSGGNVTLIGTLTYFTG